jgi:hypothetical protein
MDAAIVIENGTATCRKLRDLHAGDAVVCLLDGIRVVPEFRERDRHGFAFMTGGISSERHVETSVERIAEMIREVKDAGGRTAFVVGPVVVHTGAAVHFCELIRRGYVDVLLAGNALAVHDIEGALYGTSLGVSLTTGIPVEGGHRHHMRAINVIRRAGGIRPAVASGLLTSGVMYECVTHDVPYVLAGSIRDDGPLPDTVMDLVEAQDRYAAALADHRAKKTTDAIKLFKQARGFESKITGGGTPLAQEIQRKLADMHYVDGVRSMGNKDYPEAAKHFRLALSVSSDHNLTLAKQNELAAMAKVLYEEGYMAAGNGHTEVAKQKYKEVLLIAPSTNEYYKKARQRLSTLK